MLSLSDAVVKMVNYSAATAFITSILTYCDIDGNYYSATVHSRWSRSISLLGKVTAH